MKMRKTYLSVIFILCTLLNIQAQDKNLKDLYKDVTTAINSALLTRPGVMELSGFLSYNNMKTNFKHDSKTTQTMIQVEPQFSYFFMDNVSLGLVFSHSYSKTEAETPSLTFSSEQTSAGPLIKFYFAGEKVRPFIFTDYLYMFGDAQGSELDLGAGIFYHISGNFGMNFFGKYGIIWPEASNIDNQDRFFIGIGLSNFIL